MNKQIDHTGLDFPVWPWVIVFSAAAAVILYARFYMGPTGDVDNIEPISQSATAEAAATAPAIITPDQGARVIKATIRVDRDELTNICLLITPPHPMCADLNEGLEPITVTLDESVTWDELPAVAYGALAKKGVPRDAAGRVVLTYDTGGNTTCTPRWEAGIWQELVCPAG